MKRLTKVLNGSSLCCACAFLIAQLWRPARTNPLVDQPQTIQAQLKVTRR